MKERLVDIRCKLLYIRHKLQTCASGELVQHLVKAKHIFKSNELYFTLVLEKNCIFANWIKKRNNGNNNIRQIERKEH